ncbi:hypothetical protein SNEBB_007500 [Seison nebaliae]|nr:hypothetical protein SNEBB_007500 [Seison nebaliae]
MFSLSSVHLLTFFLISINHSLEQSKKFEFEDDNVQYFGRFPNISTTKLNELLRQHGYRLVRKMSQLDDFYLFHRRYRHRRHLKIKERNGNFDMRRLEMSMKNDFRINGITSPIIHIGIDRIHELKKREPIRINSERSFPIQWYLEPWATEYGIESLNVTSVWEEGITGKDIIIGIVDDGVEYNHRLLFHAYDEETSIDLVDDDNDPSPTYKEEISRRNNHGTRCAGVIVSREINGTDRCVKGIAHNAKFAAIKMLTRLVRDSVEAEAISHSRDKIHIYTCSWGPTDDGMHLDGPGILMLQALRDGAVKGRNGLGNIYVWAAGNGGAVDSCAADGYANNPHVIVVNSYIAHWLEVPSFLEECSCIYTTVYSSESTSLSIFTTDLNDSCANDFRGSSVGAPIVAAAIALALEVNPNLTRTDVAYLIVAASRPEGIKCDLSWMQNAAGFWTSRRYGFGLLDVGRLVYLAKRWESIWSNVIIRFRMRKRITLRYFISSIRHLKPKSYIRKEKRLNYIETVYLRLTCRVPKRGGLTITLISPMKTEIFVLQYRPKDLATNGYYKWTFKITQLWGEYPYGKWELNLRTKSYFSVIQLIEWKMEIHGQHQEPISMKENRRDIDKEMVECVVISQHPLIREQAKKKKKKRKQELKILKKMVQIPSDEKDDDKKKKKKKNFEGENNENLFYFDPQLYYMNFARRWRNNPFFRELGNLGERTFMSGIGSGK